MPGWEKGGDDYDNNYDADDNQDDYNDNHDADDDYNNDYHPSESASMMMMRHNVEKSRSAPDLSEQEALLCAYDEKVLNYHT